MENVNTDQMKQFIEAYNQLFNVPAHKASKGICEIYRKEHQNEFVTSDWSIDKHRKRFMDWMSRQTSETLKIK